MLKVLNWKEKAIMVVVVAVGIFTAGFVVGKKTTKRHAEPAAVEVKQDDGSVILERNPNRPAPAAPQIPRGARITRTTQILLEPTKLLDNAEHRPLVVQLTQIESEAGGTRVIASSEDGRIVGGTDWTAPMGPPERVYRWQAQAMKSWASDGRSAWGGSIAYTKGRFVTSVTVFPGTIQAGLGVRW